MNQRFETFVLSINKIYRCIQKIKDREMAGLGLEGTHVMCLMQLSQCPDGITAAQLSRRCLEDKAAISRSVSRLEKLSLIQFQDSGSPRRYRAKLCLTDAGRALVEKMAILVDQAVQQGGAGLTDNQRENFYYALGVIAQNLQQICTPEESL